MLKHFILSATIIMLSAAPLPYLNQAAQAGLTAQEGPSTQAQVQEIRTERIIYTHQGQTLEGFLAYDAKQKGTRPGVLVIHEWTGINAYIERRVQELAALGYVAFAADIYGQGVRPQPPAAREEAGKYYADRNLAKGRAQAGFEILRKQALVDPERTAAMGYCFGGAMTLELARSGAPLKGFISFHGGLNPTESEGKNIQGKVLVLHGAADPYIPQQDIVNFQKEMDAGQVDWQMVYYSGAVHAFSNPDAGNDPSKGAAYHAKADKRSWQAMKAFFAEIFKP